MTVPFASTFSIAKPSEFDNPPDCKLTEFMI